VTQVTIGKWGNNLAVRLPGEMIEATRLRDGERVEIAAEAGDIVITACGPSLQLGRSVPGQESGRVAL